MLPGPAGLPPVGRPAGHPPGRPVPGRSL